MMRNMSSRLFTRWMIYSGLEPFGEDWRQAGTIAAVMANTVRDPEKQDEPYRAEDFMPLPAPGDGDESEDTTWVDLDEEEQVSFIEMLNAAFGGTDLRQAPPETKTE